MKIKNDGKDVLEVCQFSHDYLTKINNKYDISKLLDCITTRYNRCSFERVIGCLMEYSGERYFSIWRDK